jgi:HEPN domain-containing protein
LIKDDDYIAYAHTLVEIAQQDYLSARLNYLSGFPRQFQWSGSQALEKVLKAICLLHRINTIKIGHDLKSLLDCLKPHLEFIHPIWKEAIEDTSERFRLLSQEGLTAFLERFGTLSNDRYGTSVLDSDGADLMKLDCTMWYFLSYFQSFNVTRFEVQKMIITESNRVSKIQHYVSEGIIGGDNANYLSRLYRKSITVNMSHREILFESNLFFHKKKEELIYTSTSTWSKHTFDGLITFLKIFIEQYDKNKEKPDIPESIVTKIYEVLFLENNIKGFQTSKRYKKTKNTNRPELTNIVDVANYLKTRYDLLP